MSSASSSSTERIRPVQHIEGTPATAIYTSPNIDEGSCLLRAYSLPTIPTEGDGGVVFLRYSLGRWHTVRIERGDLNDDDDDEVADEDEDTYRIVPLRDLYIVDSMVIRGVYFPPGEADGIRVVKFTECSIKIVQDFLRAMAEYMHIPDTTIPAHSPTDPLPLLKSPNLTLFESYTDGKDFMTGIALRAAFKPRKYLTLMAAFPYLGWGKTGGTGSLSLAQYKNLGQHKDDGTMIMDIDVGNNEENMLVNQGWFFIFDNSNIAMFTSADEDSAPLFPYQRRLGGFHLLVHMISNILSSYETAPLRKFRRTVASQELNIQTHLALQSSHPTNTSTATLAAEAATTATLLTEFEKSLSEIAVMRDVVTSQVQILEDLREIFQNSFKFEKGVGRPRNHRNAVKIPYIMDGKEQMRKAVVTVDAVIRERKEFAEELGGWLKGLRKSKILSSHDNQEVTAKEALKQAEMMQEAITQQGQTISVFTLITTVFVPLGFFTGYFGMSLGDAPSPVSTFAEFWAISGPVTILIMILMSYFLYGPDDWIKDWLKARFTWVSDIYKTWRTPKDAHTTPNQLESSAPTRRIPIYKRLSSNRASSMSGLGLEKAATAV